MTTTPTRKFDTMHQCANALKIPIAKLRAAKRAGCGAFQHGRVDAGELLTWLKQRAASKTKLKQVTVKLPPNADRLDSEIARLETLEQQLSAQALGGDDCATDALIKVSEQLRRNRLALHKIKIQRGDLRPWSEVTGYIAGILGPMRDRILCVESYAAKANPEHPHVARAALQSWIDDTLSVMRRVTGGDQ